MTKETRRSNNERNKYGICLNDECQKCKDKEVQQIPIRKEFVCTECGCELRECLPPKKKNNKLILIIVAAVVVLCGAIAAIVISNRSDKPETDSVDIQNDSVVGTSDTVAVIDTAKNETEVDTSAMLDTTLTAAEDIAHATQNANSPKKEVDATKSNKKNSSTSGGLSLSYGKYTGSIKNGYPHGQGRLTYSTSRAINKNDPKGRIANPGDYVIGEFFNGFVIYGKHYNSAGELLESLNIGVGSENSYDSK